MTPLVTYEVVTPPAAEPVSVDEVKQHLRVADDADDALLGTLAEAAREACEAYSRCVFVTQTLRASWDADPGRTLMLGRGPVQDVASVTTYGADDTSTVIDAERYFVDLVGGRVTMRETGFLDEYGFGIGQRPVHGLSVLYDAGFGAAADVPAPIKVAIMEATRWLYDSDENDTEKRLPKIARALLKPYRRMVM